MMELDSREDMVRSSTEKKEIKIHIRSGSN